MKTGLRILMVEDSEDDALLVLHQIKKGGYDIEHERVETADEMKSLLREKPWDIILSDYKMPHFTGMEALLILKESGLDIPFIMISGTIGEDVAVEAMRTGAQDYIMKNNVYRLLPAIERELRESKNRTERKRAENALYEAQQVFRTLVENSPDIIARYDRDCRRTYVNPTYLKIAQIPQQELLSTTPMHCSLLPAASAADLQNLLGRVFDSGVAETIDVIWPMADNQDSWYNIYAFPEFDREGRVVSVMTVFRDITIRKQAEEALRQSEEQIRFLFENAPEAIFIQSHGRFVYLNSAMVRLLGASRADELLGREFSESVAPEYYESIKERIRFQQETGEPSPLKEQEYVRLDGSRIPVETTAVAIRFEDRDAHMVFVRDITARRQFEEQLRSHQANMAHLLRLGEVGEMASGLAHEINQPLCAIENYAQACLRLMERNPDRTRLEEVLKDIREQAERAGKIVHRVKGLVRKKTPQFTFVEINDIVRESIDLVSMSIRKRNVKFNVNIPDNLGPVYVDSVLIEQVILNLIRNGLEAMDNSTLSKKELTIQAQAGSNSMIEVCVLDTGCGIPAENMKKIFESFFTTKSEGLGIGLSLSRAIIESHSGKIWATANANGGTTFHFTLPTRSVSDET